MTIDEFRGWLCAIDPRAASFIDEANRTGQSLTSVLVSVREPVDPAIAEMVAGLPRRVRLHIESALYVATKQRYKDRHYASELGHEVFDALLYRNCTYCGTPSRNEYNAYAQSGPVKLRNSNFRYLYTGLDRVNTNLGYTEPNVTPCCGRCNIAKRDLSPEQFFAHVRRIISHWGPSFDMPLSLAALGKDTKG